MKAPSEKHLEDWIVANPEQLTCYDLPVILSILKRQPRWRLGVPDLIVRTDSSVAVVELKQGDIDTKAIAQCIRYMAALRQIRIAVEVSRDHEIDRSVRGFDWETGLIGCPVTTGIIIGYSIKDPNIGIVAKATHIDLYTYDYEPKVNRYTFTNRHFFEGADSVTEYLDWSTGAIGDAYVTVYNGGDL